MNRKDYPRKCPKCEDGIMSDMYTSRGWGKEGFYVCDKCENVKNIYEGVTMAPYIFFTLFEMVIFALSSNISSIGYIVYGGIFTFLLFMIYRGRMHDVQIANDYPVIGEFEGDYEPNEIQKYALKNYINKTLNGAKLIKIVIACFIFISYSVMFYFEENLDFKDYIGYTVIAVVLPIWLIFTKFEGVTSE